MEDQDTAGVDLALQDRVQAKIDAFEQTLKEATAKPSTAEWDKVHRAADELMLALAAVTMKLRRRQLLS